jgi:hypothetical protein
MRTAHAVRVVIHGRTRTTEGGRCRAPSVQAHPTPGYAGQRRTDLFRRHVLRGGLVRNHRGLPGQPGCDVPERVPLATGRAVRDDSRRNGFRKHQPHLTRRVRRSPRSPAWASCASCANGASVRHDQRADRSVARSTPAERSSTGRGPNSVRALDGTLEGSPVRRAGRASTGDPPRRSRRPSSGGGDRVGSRQQGGVAPLPR